MTENKKDKDLQLQVGKLQHDIEVFTKQLEKANKEICQEKAKNATLRQKLEQQEQECDKYKQALNKISKIANNRAIFCEHCSSDDDFSCEDCGYCKILSIINKIKEN